MNLKVSRTANHFRELSLRSIRLRKFWLALFAALFTSLLLIPMTVYAQSASGPSNLTAEIIDGAGITLSWEAPDDDASSVTGYEILRRHSENDESELIILVADTNSTDTSYTDATATASGVRYTYGVKALRGSLKSDLSNTAFAEVPEDDCPGGGYVPVPIELEATAVPIVVESTTDDYFVLYVQHVLSDGLVDLPVSVTLGEDGTTTLAENVASLPKERYRVEKFSVADPADVDGDCIDDIAELAEPVGRNPVNPAEHVARRIGAVAVPDKETYEQLSYRHLGAEIYSIPEEEQSVDIGTVEYVKFVLFDLDTDRPGVYFINSSNGLHHYAFISALGLDFNNTIRGEVAYHPHLFAPDGSSGAYSYRFKGFVYEFPFPVMNRAHTVLAANMPLIDEDLALHLRNNELPYSQGLLPLYSDSRINLVFDADIFGEFDFQALNAGEGYGLLRVRDPDERPHPHDIVIYEALPNNLPRVAGIISTAPQTPLSHVNLRAVQDGLPNAFIRDALEDPEVNSLIGSYVHYEVTEDDWTLRAATPEQVEAHYAASRPAQDQFPQRDLSVTAINPLSEIKFDDWDAFGVKAANVAELRKMTFQASAPYVPNGFAVPFYYYDEFMKANSFYDDINEMLSDPDFQSDFDIQEAELKKLRKKIKKGDTPKWIEEALTEMHATYPDGTSLRYRSSTNNEDLPAFNGAGLYDSKTQHADETEEDGISKSLKQVYASLWNFRAFTQREFHRVDHLTAAMGVLVHPNYSDERANGVAVSFDPVYGRDGAYYVNTQLGEDLVTNPEVFSVPEELLLVDYRFTIMLATSNLLPPGEVLLSIAHQDLLRLHLKVIHDKFAELYSAEPSEPFAIEIEFKITSDDVLSIKQARPWVFSAAVQAGHNNPATGVPTISDTARLGETLTADTSGIADEDGMTNAAFSYQWVSNDEPEDADIPDATGSSYTPVPADVGKSIKVRVAFIDDAGNEETLTSAPTETVDPDVKSVSIWSATMTAGLLHDGYGYSSFAGGAGNLSDTTFDLDGVTYTIKAVVAWGWMYIMVDRQLPAGLTLEVDGTPFNLSDASLSAYSYATVYRWSEAETNWSETYTVELTLYPTETEPKPENTPATGQPSIAGTAQVGDTLTSDTSSIEDIDGLDNATFSYQWVRNDGSDDPDITGATATTYTLVEADEGKTIKVTVSFTDDGGNQESLTSAATATVQAYPNTPAIGTPTISGTARVGQTLTVATSDVADQDGLTNTTFAYQWVRTENDTPTDISGAASASYTLVKDDQGTTVTVRVSFTDDAGNDESLTSASTATVASKPNSPATGAPTVSGAALVGEDLAADTSNIADANGLTNATFSYQWVRNNGSGDTDIAVATAATYTLVWADQGNTVKVTVGFTDDDGNEETLTSAGSSTVQAAPVPLTATTHDAPANHDGENPFTVEVRFTEEPRPGFSYTTLRDHAFTVTDGRVTGARRLERPSNVRWEITVAPNSDATVRVVLPATTDCEDQGAICTEDGRMLSEAAVLTVHGPPANTPPTGAPTISGTAQVDQTLTANTSSISDADGLTDATFSFQWLADDVAITDATSSTYTLTTGEQDTSIKVMVAFTDDAGNDESLTSSATAVVIAAPGSGLSLSDFDPGEDQDTLASALITAGNEGRKNNGSQDRAWYATETDDWHASGELQDGDLEWNDMTLNRVVYFPDTGVFRFNDGDPVHIGESFEPGGVNRELTIWIQTEDETVSFQAKDHIRDHGPHWINFDLPTDHTAVLDAIAEDDLIIVAVSEPASP